MSEATASVPALPGIPSAPATALEQTQAFLQAGGPVVVVLLVMSVAALAIVLAKLWQFHALRLGDRTTAHAMLRLVQAGRPGDALALAGQSPTPVAQVLARAIGGRHGGLPEVRLREEVVRHGNDVLEVLRGWFRPLEVIASLAPLLGLFGTVLGMIEAFRQLEQAGHQVNPAVLSGGIWEALLTTAVGLAVAIPVVAALNWLERRVERTAHDLESTVTRVFTLDIADALCHTSAEEPWAWPNAVASHAPSRLNVPVAAVGR
ncbi:MAG: MotA/TolQ/ExbB proton channel family protein [Rhodospirillales bacterium]|nr:MAG: MotA/TolQ/ExbB proton channel family protein [Rhodospirillales bacterium]